jgi:hypothetical protein
VSGLAGAAVGTIGVVVDLLAIEPLLIPMIVLVFLPAWSPPDGARSLAVLLADDAPRPRETVIRRAYGS